MRHEVEIEDQIADLGPSDDETQPRLRPKVAPETGLKFKDWRKKIKEIMMENLSYGSLGLKLVEALEKMSSPLGIFVRRYSPTQPLPAKVPHYDRQGDILPIHPSSISS